MVPISSMPDDLLQEFMKVFTKLHQKIIMKWETDDLPRNMPANVMTTKWLPQQDLIGNFIQYNS
jgi:UDP:flavonoid glycosyltransferase YjiC (YdhE family)